VEVAQLAGDRGFLIWEALDITLAAQSQVDLFQRLTSEAFTSIHPGIQWRSSTSHPFRLAPKAGTGTSND
jgi:hypothetical protein